MRTLITRKSPHTKENETLLYITTYYETGLSVSIYQSNEQGESLKKKFQQFINANEKNYHAKIRKSVRAKGGIVHKLQANGTVKTKTPAPIKYVVISMYRGTPVILSRPNKSVPAVFTSLAHATRLSSANSNSFVAPLYNVIDLLQRSKATVRKGSNLHDELNKIV